MGGVRDANTNDVMMMSSGWAPQGVGEETVAVGEVEDISGGGGERSLCHGAAEGAKSDGYLWRFTEVCQHIAD